MAKLGIFSGKEICRILAQHGFVEIRQRGSHIAMQKKTDNTTTTSIVPDHRDVSIGTLRSIIRQSGLPRKWFEK